jgi:hypothetical protein
MNYLKNFWNRKASGQRPIPGLWGRRVTSVYSYNLKYALGK